MLDLATHEAASDVPAADLPGHRGGVTLIERHALLRGDTDAPTPADVFEHRLDRAGRAARTPGGR
ncbi:hypothetical protein [Sorangium sp. So ce513]|uniref:hypothetical protein n=1 Tax=Sorangium sp. So ce513 TaxID=3133315 RepID=UPI003F62ECDC